MQTNYFSMHIQSSFLPNQRTDHLPLYTIFQTRDGLHWNSQLLSSKPNISVFTHRAAFAWTDTPTCPHYLAVAQSRDSLPDVGVGGYVPCGTGPCHAGGIAGADAPRHHGTLHAKVHALLWPTCTWTHATCNTEELSDQVLSACCTPAQNQATCNTGKLRYHMSVAHLHVDPCHIMC